MKIALSHHGEKKNDHKLAPLTKRGLQQAYKSAVFIQSTGVIPKKILYTPTQRTKESAQKISELFRDVPLEEINTMPYNWNGWVKYTENLYNTCPNDHIIVCHHPTLEMIKQKFHLKLSLQSYSSVIILLREKEHKWSVSTYHQGDLSL